MKGYAVDKLCFFQGDAQILHDLSFQVKRGKMVGILGPNGSGKTTLLKLLSGGLPAPKGCVRLDGMDIGNLSAQGLAQKVAVVPQRSSLTFEFSVLDVVLMGRYPYISRFSGERPEDIRVARACMEITGIEHLAERPATRLSGGEWQRVTIARALAQQTEYLLLDEPVSSLDMRYQVEVLKTLRTLNQSEGKTVLCILHDVSIAAQYCDELILLESGRIHASGRPEQVLTEQVLSQVYGLPVVMIRHPKTGRNMVLPAFED